MEIKRILWPTDYSDNAAKALPWVTSLAEKYDCEVLVLHVIQPPNRYEILADLLDQNEYQRFFENAKQHSQEKLLETCGEHLASCRIFDKCVVVGDTADQILKAIKERDIDLVVIASHGRTGLKRFSFGSVADKVSSNSPVPVLVIKSA